MPTATTRRPRARRSPRTPAWDCLTATTVQVKGDAPAAFDVTQKLDRLVHALGVNVTADLLALDRAQLRRCLKGQESLSAPVAQRVLDLEYVLDRALRIFYPDELGPWLTAPEPLLGGAIPLNVLVLRGSAPVIQALNRIAAGAFA